MHIEEFATGDSPIHRLDPRTKIIAAIVFSVVVALNHSLSATAAAMVFPVAVIAVARISITKLLRRLILVNGLILFLWCVLPFTFPGEPLYSIGPLEIHREGVLYALLLTLKSNAIILAMIGLLGTSSVFSLVHALSHMGVPDKLVHLFFFCFRYVHVIHDEYRRLVRAMKIRSFKPGTNLHTYRTYAYLMGMLLVRSFDRSERIVAAMKCRGFRGRFYILHHHEMKKSDYLLAGCSGLFAALLLVL
ncbi:MAG: cobalt ECF transporter T component CbiQ [Deltaproteobacteria bacterium]